MVRLQPRSESSTDPFKRASFELLSARGSDVSRDTTVSSEAPMQRDHAIRPETKGSAADASAAFTLELPGVTPACRPDRKASAVYEDDSGSEAGSAYESDGEGPVLKPPPPTTRRRRRSFEQKAKADTASRELPKADSASRDTRQRSTSATEVSPARRGSREELTCGRGTRNASALARARSCNNISPRRASGEGVERCSAYYYFGKCWLERLDCDDGIEFQPEDEKANLLLDNARVSFSIV